MRIKKVTTLVSAQELYNIGKAVHLASLVLPMGAMENAQETLTKIVRRLEKEQMKKKKASKK